MFEETMLLTEPKQTTESVCMERYTNRLVHTMKAMMLVVRIRLYRQSGNGIVTSLFLMLLLLTVDGRMIY